MGRRIYLEEQEEFNRGKEAAHQETLEIMRYLFPEYFDENGKVIR